MNPNQRHLFTHIEELIYELPIDNEVLTTIAESVYEYDLSIIYNRLSEIDTLNNAGLISKQDIDEFVNGSLRL